FFGDSGKGDYKYAKKVLVELMKGQEERFQAFIHDIGNKISEAPKFREMANIKFFSTYVGAAGDMANREILSQGEYEDVIRRTFSDRSCKESGLAAYLAEDCASRSVSTQWCLTMAKACFGGRTK